jgi:RNA polymerase sigma-70 factor (ECF subfamily)
MPDRALIDDAALLEAWRRGDRSAAAELFERYYPNVARFFHNKVSDAAQADLVQKTFLGCLEGAARIRGPTGFRPFLFGVARHVLVDHLRERGRRLARLGPELDVDETPAVSFGLSPITSAVRREEQRLLLEGLRRIPLLHQVALELHYWEGLTAAEIGEVLAVPRSTAKTRLRDGRAYLEQQLRELARSPEALQSTLDNLERWAHRTRAQLPPVAGPTAPATG